MFGVLERRSLKNTKQENLGKRLRDECFEMNSELISANT